MERNPVENQKRHSKVILLPKFIHEPMTICKLTLSFLALKSTFPNCRGVIDSFLILPRRVVDYLSHFLSFFFYTL